MAPLFLIRLEPADKTPSAMYILCFGLVFWILCGSCCLIVNRTIAKYLACTKSLLWPFADVFLVCNSLIPYTVAASRQNLLPSSGCTLPAAIFHVTLIIEPLRYFRQFVQFWVMMCVSIKRKYCTRKTFQSCIELSSEYQMPYAFACKSYSCDQTCR